MKLNVFVEQKIKEAVEKDGYTFHEMFYDNGMLYVTDKGSNERIELFIFDYLIKIEL